MQYFIIENGQQSGPFTPDQLYEKKITSETLVWAEGMTDWTPAWKVEELRPVIDGTYQSHSAQSTSTQAAPPVPPVSPTTAINDQQFVKQPQKKNHTVLYIIIAAIVAILFIFGCSNPSKEDHEIAIKTEVTAAVNEATSNATDQEDIFAAGFDMISRMITGSILDNALDQLLEYHNYLLFSKSTVHFNGKAHTVSYGFLGKVYTVNKDDILQAFSKSGFNVNRNENTTPQSQSDEQDDESDNYGNYDDSADKQGQNIDQKINDKVNKTVDRVTDQVSKKVSDKINQKIDEVTDSTTIDKLINKILNLL